jgi:selenocysteine-specific elongation factor
MRVHLGTAEVLGRIGLLAQELAPGETALAQLRLESPLIARAGDHVVLRSYSPVHTVAGGIVLEPDAPRRKRLAPAVMELLLGILRHDEAPHAALGLDGGSVAIAALPILTGLAPPTVTEAVIRDDRLLSTGDVIVSAERVVSTQREILRRVDAHHVAFPLEDGIDRETLRRGLSEPGDIFDVALDMLIAHGGVEGRAAAIARPDWTPTPTAADRVLLERLRSVYATAGLAAPTVEELPPDVGTHKQLPALLRCLERDGAIVRTGAGRWVAAPALLAAAHALTQLPVGPPLEVADFRNTLNLTRKHLIPLLEFFDRQGITIRRGDTRVLTGNLPLHVVSTPDGPEGALPKS